MTKQKRPQFTFQRKPEFTLHADETSERKPLYIKKAAYGRFENVADMLGIPPYLLADLVLDAFHEMVDEDHEITLPLMFQQVKAE
jgi:hypothetical protein